MIEFLSLIIGRSRQQSYQAYIQRDGVHDSYRELSNRGFNTKETKVRGCDLHGEFRISQRRDQIKMQYTMGELDMAARQLKESTQQRRRLPFVSDFVSTVAMQMQAILTLFQLERTGGISRSKENVQEVPVSEGQLEPSARSPSPEEDGFLLRLGDTL